MAAASATAPTFAFNNSYYRRHRPTNLKSSNPNPTSILSSSAADEGRNSGRGIYYFSEEQKPRCSLNCFIAPPSASPMATSSATTSPFSLSLHHHHQQDQNKNAHSSPSKPLKSPLVPRRSLLILPASSILLWPSFSLAADDNATSITSKDTTATTTIATPDNSTNTTTATSSNADATVTDRVFLDFSVCPSYFRSDRPLGAELSTCPDAEPLGRVVFGLYGRLLPVTAANFKATCATAAYRGTLVHKLFPGQFFAAGHQGRRRDKGEVRPPPGLTRNIETVDPKAFELRHVRPGTLSLCLGQNDDDDVVKFNPDYHNVEFLVTTGPGPCPELDGENIVFGTVLEGLDVITRIASIPTYKPAERIRLFNDFAEFIGDDRAQNARTMWDRPLKTVYISDCGELKVTKPSLPPSLP